MAIEHLSSKEYPWLNASTIKPFNIAINGFGRIGRNVLRAYIERFCQNPLQLQPLNIVAINDIAEPATLLHLLKYDLSLIHIWRCRRAI